MTKVERFEQLNELLMNGCLEDDNRTTEGRFRSIALPTAGQSVVRLFCTLIEDPGITGTVTFRLDRSLRDDGGNYL